MDTWAVGPFVLNMQTVQILLAVAVGYVILQLRLCRSDRKGDFSTLTVQAAVLGLAVWKLSVALFDLESIRREPLALLYFNGGVRGSLLAGAAAILYVVAVFRKKKWNAALYIDSLLLSALWGYACYNIFIILIGGDWPITRGLAALLAAGLGAAWLRSPNEGGYKPVAGRMGLAVISFALLFTLSANLWDKTGDVTATASDVGLSAGQQAPDFTLNRLDGDTVRLSDYRGKTVLLNFWATWCPPCRAEMPHMQQFFTEHERDGIVIIGVNATSTEVSVPVVKAWLGEWGITFPIALDAQGEVGKAYRVNAYPATYTIDPQGKIADKHPGPMNLEALRAAAVKAGALK